MNNPLEKGAEGTPQKNDGLPHTEAVAEEEIRKGAEGNIPANETAQEKAETAIEKLAAQLVNKALEGSTYGQLSSVEKKNFVFTELQLRAQESIQKYIEQDLSVEEREVKTLDDVRRRGAQLGIQFDINTIDPS